MTYYRTVHRRKKKSSLRPLVGFLLVASFGILFAGCGGGEEGASLEQLEQAEEFSFTADDVARFRELVGSGIGAVPRLELPEELPSIVPVLDLSSLDTHSAIRTGPEDGVDMYRVTNQFLNVRSEPRITAEQIGRFDKGNNVTVLEFVNAAWAKIKYTGGKEGYVSSRYIAKMVSEEQLAKEKKKYEGLSFVDFGFLNVRKEADSASEKLGELTGQTFVRPLSQDDVWARIAFGEGEGYVAVQYLSSFLPHFLVRQDSYNLPILHYRIVNDKVLDGLVQHIDKLQQGGYTIWTMKDFYSLLLKQEDRDVRLDPKVVILTVSHITPDTVKDVSDVLHASGVKATLFLEGQYLGSGGIDEKMLMTLMANGHDLQSGGHTGDDLRSLTNAQVELELAQSRQLLEQMTKKKVFAVAYPLGGVNDRVISKAAEAGYLLGLGNAKERVFERSQFLRMPSIVIKSEVSGEEVLSLVKGE